MRIEKHLLTDVVQKPTPNIGGTIDPRLIVIHYTGSASAAGAISWLCNRAAKASAHLVIAGDGTITQLAPFNRRSWHAGKSAWRRKPDCNSYSIGIELANPGQLRETATGHFVDRLAGKPWPAEKVVKLKHKNGGSTVPWALFDPRQLDAAREVCQALVATYPKIGEIVGHDDIAPGRKTDPGPAFPMGGFVGSVFGRQ